MEKLQNDPMPMVRRWAKRLSSERAAGKAFVRDYAFPLQAWMLGGQQLLITMGGEPVVDYALHFKQRFGARTWVAGYCNDVMNYIPSLRVLNEDKPPLASPQFGYEGARATIVYGLPAFRWADDVEALIHAGGERVVARVRVRE